MDNIIPSYLINLVSNSIYCTSQAILLNALKNRFIGFRAEIEFNELCLNHNHLLFAGGYIVPLRHKKSTLSSPIYFTVDSKPQLFYLELYKHLDKAIFSKLVYIQYDDSTKIYDWKKLQFSKNGLPFPIPKFKIFDFQGNKFVELGCDINLLLNLFTPKKEYFKHNFNILESDFNILKSYLNAYSYEQLINIYVSRLVFDGFIGFKYFKGISSDIDLIRKDNKTFRFYEIKEKDLSKTFPIGFGIDVQRLNDCLTIGKKLNTEYLYIVRQINNQKDREFLSWRFIDFIKFNELTDKSIIKEGGTGMNTYGKQDNPTLLVEERHFSTIPNLFK